MAKVTAVTKVTVVPDTGLRNELKQTMFHIENTRTLSVFYPNLLFLPCRHMLLRWWVVSRVVTGQLLYHWALCTRCAETPPSTPHGLRREGQKVLVVYAQYEAGNAFKSLLHLWMQIKPETACVT